MGFRSTLVSQEYGGTLPDWFKDRYKNKLIFPSGTMIVSCCEFKIYDNAIFDDYRKALQESGFDLDRVGIAVSVLAEDGTVSKVCINDEGIKYFVMDEMYEDDSVWAQGF